jgi:cytochrome c
MLRLRKIVSLMVMMGAAASAHAGNPVAGKAVFAQCGACHSVVPGKVVVGPSLAGVVGRKSGQAAGFAYSPAMAKVGRVWTPKVLDTFLNAPMQSVPGTRMAFAGVRNAQQRADLIAYLGTLPAK